MTIFKSILFFGLSLLGFSSYADSAKLGYSFNSDEFSTMNHLLRGSIIHWDENSGERYLVPKTTNTFGMIQIKIYTTPQPYSTLIDIDGTPAYLLNYDLIRAAAIGTDPTTIT